MEFSIEGKEVEEIDLDEGCAEIEQMKQIEHTNSSWSGSGCSKLQTHKSGLLYVSDTGGTWRVPVVERMRRHSVYRRFEIST